MIAPQNTFVPLAATPAGPVAEKKFHPLLTPKPPSPPPAQAAAEAAVAIQAAPPAPPCEPRVHIEHDGDHVRSIHIQCSCGQIIDLACVYEGGAR